MEYILGFLVGICLMLLVDKFKPRHKAEYKELTEQEEREQKKLIENMQKMFNFDINQAYGRNK